MQLKAKDRVELASSQVKGTVEHADAEFVRVRWDDGKTGILKFDRSVAYNAHRLIKLAAAGADAP